MLENLTGYYKAADGQTKKKILGCIFSEKLVFEKGRVATTPFTEPIQALFKITKVLQGSKNKKEVENYLLSTLAPQIGDKLFFYNAYNQLNTEVCFIQFSKCTPLCLRLLYKVNYFFDWQQLV